MVEVIDHHSPEAITELHRRYSRRLLGYCMKMLQQDESLAQDFVQDIFLRVMEKKHLFDPQKRFYTWLFTIASNTCKTAYRRKPVQPLEAYGDRLHGRAWGEDLAEKERFYAQLRSGLDQLDHARKTTFVLRYLEEFSLQEIAEITEVPLGTVKSRLFAATRQMSGHLKAYDPKGETSVFKLT